MKAVAVTPRRARSARLLDVPVPQPNGGEVSVRVLEVGIDGTDAEIDEGLYGEPPPGEPHLIIGHESLGRVEALGRGASGFAPGDLVVALVRRPDDCPACRAGEPDMCTGGRYLERGIRGAHGFLCERYVERTEFLVRVPEELRSSAVLLEPLSVVEKAVRHAWAVGARSAAWDPRSALVIGAGSVGLLAALALRLRGIDVVVHARSPDPRRTRTLEAIGASFIAKRGEGGEVHLADLPARAGPFDVVIEATGSAEAAMGAMGVIGPSGVLALLSVTGGDDALELCASCLNRELVLGNRAVVGSVNAHRIDFEQGVRDLARAEARWPGWTSSLITRRVPLARFREALERRREDVKVVVEV